jgi:hypothetical protein
MWYTSKRAAMRAAARAEAAAAAAAAAADDMLDDDFADGLTRKSSAGDSAMSCDPSTPLPTPTMDQPPCLPPLRVTLSRASSMSTSTNQLLHVSVLTGPGSVCLRVGG